MKTAKKEALAKTLRNMIDQDHTKDQSINIQKLYIDSGYGSKIKQLKKLLKQLDTVFSLVPNRGYELQVFAKVKPVLDIDVRRAFTDNGFEIIEDSDEDAEFYDDYDEYEEEMLAKSKAESKSEARAAGQAVVYP